MTSFAKFRISLHRDLFRFGFEELHRAFVSTSKEFDQPMASAEESVRRRYGLGPEDPVPPVEYDDVGVPSHDFWEEVGELIDETKSTSKVIRLAFLISLFHFWERHSNRWVEKPAYNHQLVMEWLRSRGLTPDAAAIKALELAANCAKHGPGPSCNALFAQRPRPFRSKRGHWSVQAE